MEKNHYGYSHQSICWNLDHFYESWNPKDKKENGISLVHLLFFGRVIEQSCKEGTTY